MPTCNPHYCIKRLYPSPNWENRATCWSGSQGLLAAELRGSESLWFSLHSAHCGPQSCQPCLVGEKERKECVREAEHFTLWPNGLQHARPPCPSPNPRVYSNSCPLSWWCHPTISSSATSFSSCYQSFPASGSFQKSQLFASGDQSIGVSASTSVLPMNIQDWSPLGWTGWISL